MSHVTRHFIVAVHLLVSVAMDGGVNMLPRSRRYVPERTRQRTGHGDLLENIRRQNDAISRLLSGGSKTPHFRDDTASYEVAAGSVVPARLLNPVVSGNPSSPVIVGTLRNAPLPRGTKFLCEGDEKDGRIHTVCNVMVLEGKEYPVSVRILNPDGSAGLRGDVHTGDDQKILGGVSAALLEDAAAKGTPRALRDAVGEISGLVREGSTERQKTVVSVEAGTPVVVYFGKGFQS